MCFSLASNSDYLSGEPRHECRGRKASGGCQSPAFGPHYAKSGHLRTQLACQIVSVRAIEARHDGVRQLAGKTQFFAPFFDSCKKILKFLIRNLPEIRTSTCAVSREILARHLTPQNPPLNPHNFSRGALRNPGDEACSSCAMRPEGRFHVLNTKRQTHAARLCNRNPTLSGIAKRHHLRFERDRRASRARAMEGTKTGFANFSASLGRSESKREAMNNGA